MLSMPEHSRCRRRRRGRRRRVGRARAAPARRDRRRGAVRRAARGRYATDASIYQIMPVGVLVPRSERDVAVALDIARDAESAGAAARRRHQPVRPDGRRGAGHRHQQVSARASLDVDARARTRDGRAGPRARPPQRALKPHGLWFPVDVSTSAQATLGGMAGNNSCGSRSIAYGNMVHNVLGDRRLPGRRQRGRVRAGRERSSGRAARDRRRSCATSPSAHRDEIEARWPKVLRRVGGYNLDIFDPQSERPYTDDGSVNLAHLLVGSEGTLACHAAPDAEARAAAAGTRRWASSTSRPSTRRWTAAQHIVKLEPDARSSWSTAR